MANILISILGKGQAELIGDKEATYRPAYYFRPDQETETIIETPFVGEALIRLFSNETDKFDKVIIMGTNDAMWDVLYYYATQERDAVFNAIRAEKAVRQISDKSLKAVADCMGKRWNVVVECIITPLGKSTEEINTIFNTILTLPAADDRVSLDITHGLRFHPIVMILATMYLRALKHVQISHVFYGALELSSEFNGRMPIFDLFSLLKLSDWVDAAGAFRDYGDFSKITALLPNEEGSIFQTLAQSAQNLVIALQINAVDDARKEAQRMIDIFNDDALQSIPPLSMVRPALLAFPQEVAQPNSEWHLLLRIARRNTQHGQIGIAVLTTWEAVLHRFAHLFRVDLSAGFDYHMAISKFVRDKRVHKTIADATLRDDFTMHLKRLHEYRNAIAHTDSSERFRPKKVAEEIPKILSFFEMNIDHFEFVMLVQQYNIQQFMPPPRR
jgi:CRISPR-associated Csx2 family protein